MLKAFKGVIIGAPASGKGTISSRIVKSFDVKHISSGDVLRHHMFNNTGFPRTKMQAEALTTKVRLDAALNLVVPFDIIIDRVKGRWIHEPSGRIYNTEYSPPKIPGKDDITGDDLIQRPDDQPEAVKKRLEIYSSSIEPVLAFYREQGILKEFTGRSSNEIWPHVYDFLLKYMKPKSEH
ncbi:GTP:AMP phosphotransferase AK3 [Blattella germanica]|nr:GTP:AMP phosphotransferase AK3 [Blattella germanica]